MLENCEKDKTWERDMRMKNDSIRSPTLGLGSRFTPAPMSLVSFKLDHTLRPHPILTQVKHTNHVGQGFGNE